MTDKFIPTELLAWVPGETTGDMVLRLTPEQLVHLRCILQTAAYKALQAATSAAQVQICGDYPVGAYKEDVNRALAEHREIASLRDAIPALWDDPADFY